MNYADWKDKAQDFKVIDVRQMQGNFFPAIQRQAKEIKVGEGFRIIQTFEPHPLYGAMEAIGYVHHTEEVAKNEFHVYFYKAEDLSGDADKAVLKPLALLNFPMIDEDLGNIAMEFWNTTWNSDKRTLSYEMRLLLSLTNAVGAGRMRQATRELVKAYSCGVESAVFDDVFELIAWNQGIGFFASEIGPSTLFRAYKMIKKMEEKGKDRSDIMAKLMEDFGEKNAEVSVK